MQPCLMPLEKHGESNQIMLVNEPQERWVQMLVHEEEAKACPSLSFWFLLLR